MNGQTKPPQWEFVGPHHSRFNGRDYYGTHADDLAELAYRRALCEWYEQRLRAAGVGS